MSIACHLITLAFYCGVRSDSDRGRLRLGRGAPTPLETPLGRVASGSSRSLLTPRKQSMDVVPKTGRHRFARTDFGASSPAQARLGRNQVSACRVVLRWRISSRTYLRPARDEGRARNSWEKKQNNGRLLSSFRGWWPRRHLEVAPGTEFDELGRNQLAGNPKSEVRSRPG